MTKQDQKSPAFLKLKGLTLGALKTKAKKAKGEELEMINFILNGDTAETEVPETEVPAEDATATEELTANPELQAELDELNVTLEAATKAKKTNAAKKIQKRIDDILEEMNVTPVEVKADKPAKAKKEVKAKDPKKTSETAVVTSEDDEVQGRINELHQLVGEDLKNELVDLKMEGIDVEFISFITKGDEVSFPAANNSPLKGQTLTGIVVGNTDMDSNGRKYCRVRVEGQKASFQKSQMAVTRIALPVIEEAKVPKLTAAEKKAAAKAEADALKATETAKSTDNASEEVEAPKMTAAQKKKAAADAAKAAKK